MRTARIKAEGAGYYHCLSRVVDRRAILSADQQERFRRLMRKCEAFCGVRILTYAIMNNHFHILVNVPEREEISDAELIRRLKIFYPKPYVQEVERLIKEARKEGSEGYVGQVREKYLRRMYDVSQFMKTLKQRFSTGYNRGNGRKGTLWEERFKSILVEGTEQALVMMASYIDLNPVRAGVVKDPKDYRYCGYAEAVGGGSEAREGLRRVMAGLGVEAGWAEVAKKYRQMVFMRGEEKGTDAMGKPIRVGISREKVAEVVDAGGRLGTGEVLRCRVRYFSDGVVLGTKDFVNRVFEQHRREFGLKRRTGARAMKWAEWGGLCTMRDLRQTVVSVSG
jgi:REP element-mobilizing transposase RayT